MTAPAAEPRPSRRWISPLECSCRLGLHVMTIYKMAGSGELPCSRVGRCLRLDWEAIEKDLEAQTKGPAAKGKAR